ncbi:MAG: SCO family protein [Acidiferrobacterales bacterium]
MRLALLAVIGVAAFGLGLGGGYLLQQSTPNVVLQRATLLGDRGTPLPDFKLESAGSRVFTRDQLRGRWTLLFFGYTNCPDICPLTLSEMKDLFQQLKGTPYEQDTQVVFVSVDPKRDTPALLKRYVQHFHKEFVGVTGNAAELKRLAQALGIIYFIHGEGDNYLVDHSAAVLLVDPEGRLYATFSAPHEASVLATDYLALRDAAS